MKENDEAVVHAIEAGRRLQSRLAGMGITIGTRVRVLRNSGGLVILLVSETRVAIGRGEADKILVGRVEPAVEEAVPARAARVICAALAGQPNVGKSTVFNILTGLSQHVGNWPGKTVEKKEGVHISGDYEIRIVDLPGTYSLTAFSEEEKIARDFIIHEFPDIIILIVNAAALERSLYLLTELLLLGPPVIVAVNMIDAAEAQGIHVDIQKLRKSLGIPVVPMVAKRNVGLRELVREIVMMAEGKLDYHPKLPDVSGGHQAVFLKLLELTEKYVPESYAARWIVVKLMEGDPEISKKLEQILPSDVWSEIQSELMKHEDSHHAVVDGRYTWIETAARASILRFKRGQVLITDRIDHALTRPVFGIPVLLGVLAVVFSLTYKIGFPIQKRLDALMQALSGLIEPILAPAPYWVKGFIINGIIGGAGSVLTFLPILIIFFASMAFLEDIGYMARAAFVMDRFMHLIGLHGKSFIPMCLGFGCNVPAILGARIIESKKARLLTILLTPFIPCTARLAVLTLVTAAVFAERAVIVSWSLLALNILVLGILGILISRLALKDEAVPFIMELPLYHRPDPKTIGFVVWTRTIAFVKRAGTIILAVSVIIWLLANLPGGNTETSILGYIGRWLEPVGRPVGLDWKMIVALLSSLIAKENSIAVLGVLYGVGEEGIRTVLPQVMNPASALAFLAILMLFVPCAATIAAMKQEMENWKWFLGAVFTMLVISYTGGWLAHRLALFLGL